MTKEARPRDVTRRVNGERWPGDGVRHKNCRDLGQERDGWRYYIDCGKELVAQYKVLNIATMRLWVQVTLPIKKEGYSNCGRERDRYSDIEVSR